ncbi:MAG: hypothetical protein ACJAST_003867 [Halopseudomonas sp.]|jgi:hypothetical protein
MLIVGGGVGRAAFVVKFPSVVVWAETESPTHDTLQAIHGARRRTSLCADGHA